MLLLEILKWSFVGAGHGWLAGVHGCCWIVGPGCCCIPLQHLRMILLQLQLITSLSSNYLLLVLHGHAASCHSGAQVSSESAWLRLLAAAATALEVLMQLLFSDFTDTLRIWGDLFFLSFGCGLDLFVLACGFFQESSSSYSAESVGADGAAGHNCSFLL